MTTRTSNRRAQSPAGTRADGALEQASLDKLQAVHDTLARAVADLAHGDAWQRMLRTAARFHHYSPHNVLLITAQCPQAEAVAGYRTWKQLDRQVRQGERGIAILAPVVRRRSHASDGPSIDAGSDAPLQAIETATRTGNVAPDAPEKTRQARRLAGFRVVHVFDISQTDGPPLPTQPLPELLDGHAPDGLLDALTMQVVNAGYQLTFEPLSVPHPGLAGANGVTDYLARTVTVRPDLSPAQTVKTLAHELGHVLLHAPDQRPSTLTREQAEVEAESVAFVIAAAHGLDSSSYTVPYVAGWASADVDLIRGTAERVLSAARQVLSAAPPNPTFAMHERPDGSHALEPAARAPIAAERSALEPAITHDAFHVHVHVNVADPDIDRDSDRDVAGDTDRLGAAPSNTEAIDLSYADWASTASTTQPPGPERLGQQLLFLCDPEPGLADSAERGRQR